MSEPTTEAAVPPTVEDKPSAPVAATPSTEPVTLAPPPTTTSKPTASSAKDDKSATAPAAKSDSSAPALAPAPAPAVKPPRKEFPNRELRTKSGGAPKGKMTPEELEAKMAAMRIKNEKLQAKREATEADEKAYAASREADLAAAKAARQAEVDRKARAVAHQASINAEREKTAQAKLKKVEGRAWDKEKVDKKESAGGELNYPSKTARKRSPPPHMRKDTDEKK